MVILWIVLFFVQFFFYSLVVVFFSHFNLFFGYFYHSFFSSDTVWHSDTIHTHIHIEREKERKKKMKKKIDNIPEKYTSKKKKRKNIESCISLCISVCGKVYIGSCVYEWLNSFFVFFSVWFDIDHYFLLFCRFWILPLFFFFLFGYHFPMLLLQINPYLSMLKRIFPTLSMIIFMNGILTALL